MTGPKEQAPAPPRPCNLDGHRPAGRKPMTQVWDPHHQARVWADYVFAGPTHASRMHGVSMRTVYNLRDAVEADPELFALGQAKLAALREDLDARSLEVFGLSLSAVANKLQRTKEYKLGDAVAALETMARVFGRHKGQNAQAQGAGTPVLYIPQALVSPRPPGVDTSVPPPQDEDP